jgi:uncharacterized protein YdgA (DUF945 family)
MRKILVFIAAFVLAIVTMPFFFGLLAEYQIQSSLDKANLPEGVIVEVKSYDRGYAHSHAVFGVTLVELVPNAPPKHVASFTLESEIDHGPLLSSSAEGYHSGLAKIHAYIKPENIAFSNDQLAKSLASIFENQEILSLDATLGIFASIRAHLHSSPAHYQGEDGSINWGGVDASFDISHNRNAMKASVDIAPMLLQAQSKASLDFSRISFVSDAKRDKGMPWVGEQTLNVPSFYMRSPTGDEARFSNLIFTGKSEVKNNLASMEFLAKADNLELYTQAIKDTELSMQLGHLNPKAFVEFSGYTQGDMNAMNDEEKQAFKKALVTMLSPGALFTFEHGMNISEGPVSTKISVQFPNLEADLGKSTEDVLAQRLLTEVNATLATQAPKLWLENTLYKIALSHLPPDAPTQIDPVTQAKITAQEALHRSILNQLKTLTQAGVLVSDETHYALHLNYEKGNIMLNGNKLTQEDIAKIMGMLNGK